MNEQYLRRAIQLAQENSASGDKGPFGAVVVLDDKIIGEGWNQVVNTKDPTAHAEVIAIRNACKNIDSHDLHKSVIYTSCEPCPMCLAAIYWARIEKVYYACSRYDAANIGFDDKIIYDEFVVSEEKKKIKLIQSLKEEGIKIFDEWKSNPNKIMY
jgi:tRNA(Arg) A34 adenosine deaminase TadA